MSKPFNVVYSPDNWSAPAGGVATQWTTPFGGLHVQAPDNTIGPQYSPALSNVILRNSEIRTRPQFRQAFGGPDGTAPVLAVGSFLSKQQILHTFAVTGRGLFQLKTNAIDEMGRGNNPWSFVGPSLAQNNVPVSWASYAGILYYANFNNLWAWDGAFEGVLGIAFTGPSLNVGPPFFTIGAIFVAELDNHILLAYVYETLGGVTTILPNRIRWSNNGFNPTNAAGVFGGNVGTAGATFDPTINVNAGLNDFLDVPDIITGVMTLGRVGYIFRQNGITELTATGRGIAPFDFNHLWASQHGIGNVYPFSIAQYGNMGIFISFEQIYQITTGGLNAIGAGARDAIMADIANAVGPPKASLDRGFTLGYTYLHYHLRIPQAGGTKSYVFSVEDNNWTTWFTTGVWPTGMSNECWI